MLQIIIFSFNRAMQLDTLLRSVYKHFKFDNYRVEVLYNTSDRDFEKGYDLLKGKYLQVEFVKESTNKDHFGIKDAMCFYNLKKIIKHKQLRNAKSDFRSLLCGMLHGNADCSMFLTDDSAFYSDVCLTDDILSWVNEKPLQRSFSLRLGIGINQEEPKTEKDGFVYWDYYKSCEKKNWTYQFSVDGHIYSTKLLRQLADKIFFTNPSFFESMVCNYVREKRMLSEGMCFRKSTLLSYPINMVQKVADNESLNASLETLNEKFLEGYTFDYEVPEKIEVFQQYPASLTLKRNGNENIKLSCL